MLSGVACHPRLCVGRRQGSGQGTASVSNRQSSPATVARSDHGVDERAGQVPYYLVRRGRCARRHPWVLADLASRALGVSESNFRVVFGDSVACLSGEGSYASRTVFCRQRAAGCLPVVGGALSRPLRGVRNGSVLFV